MIITLEEASTVLHFAKDVKCEKGVRKTKVRCGASIIDDVDTAPTEWTVWESRVTCEGCAL